MRSGGNNQRERWYESKLGSVGGCRRQFSQYCRQSSQFRCRLAKLLAEACEQKLAGVTIECNMEKTQRKQIIYR